MNGKDNQAGQTADLRQRAEEIIRQQTVQSPAPEAISSEELRKILHELCVHQLELEMQNEELRQSKVALHASQNRYFELYDLAPVGYCTISEQGMILEGNLAAADMLGMGRNLLARQPFSRFILKADQDIYYRYRQQLLENGEPQACELRMIKKDRTAFWGHLAISSAQDTYGNPELRIVLGDISELKFKEEAGELTARLIVLVNSQSSSFRERMAELTAALQSWSGCEAVGIRLRDGNDYPYFETRGFPLEFVDMENHLCAYDKNGELLRDSEGKPVLECMCGNILNGRFDPDKPFFTAHGSFWTNSTTTLLATTSEAGRQSRTRSRCNTEGYESVALIPLREGHQVFGLLQFNDRRRNCFSPGLIEHFEKMADSLAIALAQRQSEEALRVEQENLQAIFAAAPVGMLLLDEENMIVNSNAVIARLVRRDQNRIIRQRGGSGLGCVHSFEDERGCGFSSSCGECPLSKGIQQVLQSGNSVHGAEIQYAVLIDGQAHRLWLNVNAEQVLLDGRKHVIVAIDDITGRKKTEAELIKALEKAEESDRLKSAFLANMSHEIRTPMNGILGFTGLLQEPHLADEEQQQYISMIEKSGERMLNIINNIINISKIEAGQMEVAIAATNINEQIEYIYNFFKPEVEHKGMQLSFKNTLPAKAAVIQTDSEKVYAILTNLVKNAIKFTPAGSIEFGYEKKGEFLEFFVKDTGIGIPRDKQAAVFDRFVQLHIGDRRAFQGAGLGLAITKAYVEMLGGRIWEESEEGKGTVFYFTIPYNAVTAEKSVIENAVPAEITADKKESPVRKLKILIVEDDEKSEILITIIVKDFNKEILKARTGAAAVDFCRNNSDIDLVLMDIEMPELDGYEAARQIRQFNKDVVIIAQTAYALAGDRAKSIAAGCNDYIAKPYNKTSLTALLKKYFK